MADTTSTTPSKHSAHSMEVMELDLSGNLLEEEKLSILADAIARNQSLVTLTLEAAGVGATAGSQKLMSSLQQHPSLTYLSLGNNTLAVRGCEMLTRSLSLGANSLMFLDLSANQIGEGVSCVSAFLRSPNCVLSSLNLSYNFIGPERSKSLSSALLVNSSLKLLKLNNCELKNEGCRYLAAALSRNGSIPLVTLELDKNMVTKKGGQFIAELITAPVSTKTLSTLSLKGNHIGEGAEDIAVALAGNTATALTSLNLAGSSMHATVPTKGLDVRGFDVVLQSIRNSTHLTKLDLSENHLGLRGAGVLASIFRSSGGQLLRELKLADNELGPEGLAVLVKGLIQNSTLTSLDLSNNGIGESGSELVSRFLCQPTCAIKELTLCKNGIGLGGCTELGFIFFHNTVLESLDLSENRIFATGMEHLIKPLRDSKCPLKTLILKSCHLTSMGAQVISEQLKANSSLTRLNLEDNQLDDLCADAMSSFIRNHPTLADLTLSSNQFSIQALKQLSESVSHNKHIIILRLKNSKIDCEGASAIVANVQKAENLRCLDLGSNPIGADSRREPTSQLDPELNSKDRHTLWETLFSAESITSLGLSAISIGLADLVSLSSILSGSRPGQQPASAQKRKTVTSRTTVTESKRQSTAAATLRRSASMNSVSANLGSPVRKSRFSTLSKTGETVNGTVSLPANVKSILGSSQKLNGSTGSAMTAIDSPTSAMNLQPNQPSDQNRCTADHLMERMSAISGPIKLDFNNVKITVQTASLLRDCLWESPNIVSIEMERSGVTDQMWKLFGSAVLKRTEVKRINLNNNLLTHVGSKVFINGMVNNTSLLALELGRNQIGAIGATNLVLALSRNGTLTALGLSANNIKAEGALAIAGLLKLPLCSLKHIDLTDNKIGSVGTQAIGSALILNRSVVSIGLASNNIEANGIESIFESIRTANNTAIVKLDLWHNSVLDVELTQSVIRTLDKCKRLRVCLGVQSNLNSHQKILGLLNAVPNIRIRVWLCENPYKPLTGTAKNDSGSEARSPLNHPTDGIPDGFELSDFLTVISPVSERDVTVLSLKRPGSPVRRTLGLSRATDHRSELDSSVQAQFGDDSPRRRPPENDEAESVQLESGMSAQVLADRKASLRLLSRPSSASIKLNQGADSPRNMVRTPRPSSSRSLLSTSSTSRVGSKRPASAGVAAFRSSSSLLSNHQRAGSDRLLIQNDKSQAEWLDLIQQNMIVEEQLKKVFTELDSSARSRPSAAVKSPRITAELLQSLNRSTGAEPLTALYASLGLESEVDSTENRRSVTDFRNPLLSPYVSLSQRLDSTFVSGAKQQDDQISVEPSSVSVKSWDTLPALPEGEKPLPADVLLNRIDSALEMSRTGSCISSRPSSASTAVSAVVSDVKPRHVLAGRNPNGLAKRSSSSRNIADTQLSHESTAVHSTSLKDEVDAITDSIMQLKQSFSEQKKESSQRRLLLSPRARHPSHRFHQECVASPIFFEKISPRNRSVKTSPKHYVSPAEQFMNRLVDSQRTTRQSSSGSLIGSVNGNIDSSARPVSRNGRTLELAAQLDDPTIGSIQQPEEDLISLLRSRQDLNPVDEPDDDLDDEQLGIYEDPDVSQPSAVLNLSELKRDVNHVESSLSANGIGDQVMHESSGSRVPDSLRNFVDTEEDENYDD
eukprot:GILK01009240.1.p1 GENE.GILK01009240.1~~GILK01009240.1.p1  ORF type:complete len:1664 (+),score=377.67 GILK01009240.1:149-5140(+)